MCNLFPGYDIKLSAGNIFGTFPVIGKVCKREKICNKMK